jgi:hypothetical protein
LARQPTKRLYPGRASDTPSEQPDPGRSAEGLKLRGTREVPALGAGGSVGSLEPSSDDMTHSRFLLAVADYKQDGVRVLQI